MPRVKPYQPFLLRVLHGLNAVGTIAALVTGYLVYDSWDGRFGRLELTTDNRALIDIHGTFAFVLFFVFIGFAIYSVKAGRSRLFRSDSWQHLSQVGKPIWWLALQRIANTTMLLAVGLSVVSGKFQSEEWLPQGELNHLWYFVHLGAWVLVVLAILLHVLLGAKVGGVPLLLSMLETRYRPEESPALWKNQVLAWLRHPRW
ncbi:MAG: cytochrome b/b6 domain-containing protein [Geitlerinemataceae cyanobacterium]